MCSQQLHLTLPEGMLRRFRALADRHGYKNVQAVILSVLDRFSRRAEMQEQRATPIRLSMEDEIDDMFNELSRIHLMPEDTAPPKTRRPRRNQIERKDARKGAK